jgi:hypothetical protein
LARFLECQDDPAQVNPSHSKFLKFLKYIFPNLTGLGMGLLSAYLYETREKALNALDK